MKSKKRSRISPKKRSKKRIILDGGVDIVVIARDDILGGRYLLSVNSDDSVQSIFDKYKCELVKNSKWPINENEYKYILKITDRVLELDQTISEVGIENESTIVISSQKINNELEKKVLELEGDFNQKIEQLEKKVLELEGINWISYFGVLIEPYYYNGTYMKVSVDVIKSALTIIKSVETPSPLVCYKLFMIMRYMNDENLEKLIPFLIDNNIGISGGASDILKFNDPDFSNKLMKVLEGYGDKVDVFNKINRVMAKIYS
jgi:hypothetical protein